MTVELIVRANVLGAPTFSPDEIAAAVLAVFAPEWGVLGLHAELLDEEVIEAEIVVLWEPSLEPISRAGVWVETLLRKRGIEAYRIEVSSKRFVGSRPAPLTRVGAGR